MQRRYSDCQSPTVRTIKRAHELAATGRYSDYAALELALRLYGYPDPRRYLNTSERAELGRLCAESKAQGENSPPRLTS